MWGQVTYMFCFQSLAVRIFGRWKTACFFLMEGRLEAENRIWTISGANLFHPVSLKAMLMNVYLNSKHANMFNFTGFFKVHQEAWDTFVDNHAVTHDMVTIGIDMVHGAATALRLLQAKFSPWTGLLPTAACQCVPACQRTGGVWRSFTRSNCLKLDTLGGPRGKKRALPKTWLLKIGHLESFIFHPVTICFLAAI